MRIDLLYFEGCPGWQTAHQNLKTALSAEGITAEIRLLKIDDPATAELWRFPGSPSIRVDGEDWWRLEREHYEFSCRLYETPQGRLASPTVEMLRERLQELRAAVLAFIKNKADHFDEVVIEDGQNDSYSVKQDAGKFYWMNFSPREGALYSQTEIPFETALGYLRQVGFSYSF